jgi:hypothetical protein
MSSTVVFIVGAIIFAITVYGAVIAGGLALTRKELEGNQELRRRVVDDATEVPLRAEY